MSEKITRRGLLGRLLAGLLAPFAGRAEAQAAPPPTPPTPPAPVPLGPASWPSWGPVTTYVYDSVGPVTYFDGAGRVTTVTYDPGRPT